MSPNKNYLRGRAAEYKVTQRFLDQGYVATRTAGSHGPYDVIGISPWFVDLIQVKVYSGKSVPKSVMEDARSLEELAVPDENETVRKWLLIFKHGKGLEKCIRLRSARQTSSRQNASRSEATGTSASSTSSEASSAKPMGKLFDFSALATAKSKSRTSSE